jgi:cell division protein FtsB
MSEATLITIASSFISLLLIVNAYFTRETLLRVVKIEVKLEQNSTKQEYIERQSNDDHRELQKLRDRVHSLEGNQAQLLGYLEEIKK